jgi:hypothetical protein
MKDLPDDLCLSRKQIATAIFEYAEKRGFPADRKRGVRFENHWGNLRCWVREKNNIRKKTV